MSIFSIGGISLGKSECFYITEQISFLIFIEEALGRENSRTFFVHLITRFTLAVLSGFFGHV